MGTGRPPGRPRKIIEPEVEISESKTNDPKDAFSAIQEYFSSLAPGFRVTIYRTKPQEFRSLLEEYEISDDGAPLDLNYLARMWGGKELKLKVRDEAGRFVKTVTLPMFSHPPLYQGKPLSPTTPQIPEVQAPQPPPYPSFMNPRYFPTYDQFPQQQTPPPPPPQPQAISPSANLAELLGAIQQFRSSDTQLVTELLQRSLLGFSPTPPQPPNPYQQLNHLIETMRNLQTVMQPAQQTTALSGEDDMLGNISRLLEIVLSKDRTQPQQPPKPQLTAPGASITPINEAKPLERPETPQQMSGAQIIKSIAGADPKAVAAVLSEAMRTMSPDQRRAAIEAFEDQFASIAPELYGEDEEEEIEETEESEKTSVS